GHFSCLPLEIFNANPIHAVIPGRREAASPESMNTRSCRISSVRVHGPRAPSLRSGPGVTASQSTRKMFSSMISNQRSMKESVGGHGRSAALAHPTALTIDHASQAAAVGGRRHPLEAAKGGREPAGAGKAAGERDLGQAEPAVGHELLRLGHAAA